MYVMFLIFAAWVLTWNLAKAAQGSNSHQIPASPPTYYYGVDVSYPIHWGIDRNSFQGKRYEELMAGCARAYSRAECEATEKSRLKMSLDQPRTQHNYTTLGFKKMRVPEDVFSALRSFYDSNKANKKLEQWSRGYTYTNHWSSPTYMVSPEDSNLRGGGTTLKNFIWEGISPIIEEWTGHKLRPTSMYGVRIYTDGAILATHVDRLPLVSSCIVNVDQDVREPWPIEVYDHDGVAHNVTMEPGDMVLYESSTVLHGRPAPLNGSHYANIFIHFEPIDHKQMNELDKLKRMGLAPDDKALSEVQYAEEEEEEEDDDHADAHSIDVNIAAARGQLNKIKNALRVDANKVHSTDVNGWQPIHEAVRAGHTNVVKYLVENGADIGALTKNGGSPLWWAKRALPRGHRVIKFLEEMGAPEEGEL